MVEILMNESMPGNADDPNNFTSSFSRVGASAAREYVEHPYWFALAIVLTAALALPQVINFSNDAMPSTALASKPHVQSQAVTRALEPPNQSLTPSTEPPNRPLTPSTEPQIQSVKFPNPFDSDEIFEFDPGTSKEDARAAVVEILKERALGRQ
jgi:hypothetical protein